mgnify:CR=1 FL=1
MLKNEDHKLPKFVEDVDCNSKSSEDRSPNCGENGDHTVYRDLRFKKNVQIRCMGWISSRYMYVKPYWKVPLIGLLEAYLLKGESYRYLYQGLVSLLQENPTHIGFAKFASPFYSIGPSTI